MKEEFPIIHFQNGGPCIVTHRYRDPTTGNEVMEEYEHWWVEDGYCIIKQTGRFLTQSEAEQEKNRSIDECIAILKNRAYIIGPSISKFITEMESLKLTNQPNDSTQ